MTIETRDFGAVEINESDIVTFVQPIFGFDELTKYVFLFNQYECTEFAWLQSIEDKEICFILADPAVLSFEYSPDLPQQLESDLGDGEVILWLVAVITEEYLDSTVNLKSPIVFNTSTRKAAQVILEQQFSIRQKIL